MVDAKQLHGWSLEDAECMGKPHFGARYTTKDAKNLGGYVRESWLCSICGRDAINTHHQPYRQTFEMVTPNGIWTLKPALFALCGSGTTGCHGAIEHNRIKVRWKWDTPEAEAAWWSGELLAKYGPHSIELYRFGAWDIELENGGHIERRKTLKRGR